MSHLVKALWDELCFVNMGYTNKIWLIDWLIIGWRAHCSVWSGATIRTWTMCHGSCVIQKTCSTQLNEVHTCHADPTGYKTTTSLPSLYDPKVVMLWPTSEPVLLDVSFHYSPVVNLMFVVLKLRITCGSLFGGHTLPLGHWATQSVRFIWPGEASLCWRAHLLVSPWGRSASEHSLLWFVTLLCQHNLSCMSLPTASCSTCSSLPKKTETYLSGSILQWDRHWVDWLYFTVRQRHWVDCLYFTVRQTLGYWLYFTVRQTPSGLVIFYSETDTGLLVVFYSETDTGLLVIFYSETDTEWTGYILQWDRHWVTGCILQWDRHWVTGYILQWDRDTE